LSDPTLAYLHRRFLARRLLRGVSPGRFLEVGVGRGKFYEDLLHLGFAGLCLDLNPTLIAQQTSECRFPADRVQFASTNFFSLDQKFKLLIAFEVLEHYQEDLACIRKWRSLLDRQGALLFSVPAHVRHWTENDDRAGHARRYEKLELAEKLNQCGFQVEQICCYGFPLLNVTYPLSSRLLAQPPKSFEATDNDPLMTDFCKTAQSGDRHLPFSGWIFDERLWLPWLHLQRLFLDGDHGTGYIVKCQAI